MRYEVYLDSYFWLNFILNGFILYLTGKMLGLRISLKRLLPGAALAAVLSCTGIFLPLPGIVKLSVWQILCNAVTIMAAFSIRQKKTFLYALFFLYGAAGMVGAAVTWAARMAEYLTGRRVSPVLLLLAAGGSGILCGNMLQKIRQHRRRQILPVIMQENGQQLQVNALLDTGNSLKEPFSGKPVCILDRECFDKLAEEPYRRANPQKCRIIPYHSIGKKHGWMEGFCVNRMQIDTGEEQIDLKDVIVALSDHEITENGQYQMILHPSMIGEEEEST